MESYQSFIQQLEELRTSGYNSNKLILDFDAFKFNLKLLIRCSENFNELHDTLINYGNLLSQSNSS